MCVPSFPPPSAINDRSWYCRSQTVQWTWCCHSWMMFECRLKLFPSTCSCSPWPRLPSSPRTARKAKATTAPSASRRGRRRASTGWRRCAADTSSASDASSTGWKLRARPLNVRRSARSLDFNRKLISWTAITTRFCCRSVVQQEGEAFGHCPAVRSKAEGARQLRAGELKEVSDAFSASWPKLCIVRNPRSNETWKS